METVLLFKKQHQETKCCMVKYLSFAPCRALVIAKLVFSFTVINRQCLPTEEIKHCLCVSWTLFPSRFLTGQFLFASQQSIHITDVAYPSSNLQGLKNRRAKFSTGLSMNRSLTQALKASQYQETPC